MDVCLILDQFGELITCPIQEWDGARRPKTRKKNPRHHARGDAGG